MYYADWITAVTTILEYDLNLTDPSSPMPTDSTAFNNIIPAAIDYTENRIQRDLDLIATIQTIPGTMLANQRLQALPSTNIITPGMIPSLVGTPVAAGSILTTTASSLYVNVNWPSHGIAQGNQVTIITPTMVGGLTLGGVFTAITIVDANNFTIVAPSPATSSASAVVIGNGLFVVARQIRLVVSGAKQPPLEVVSRDSLDYFWPGDASISNSVLPQQWCSNDQSTVLVGPAPPTAQAFEALGTMRFPKLSSTQTANFLTLQTPDLYVACSMVFFSGYQRSFGEQSDDPKLAQSWENQYQTLLASAKVEEIRKTFSNMYPTPSRPTPLKAGG